MGTSEGYTLEGFVRGEPEALIQAADDPKILIYWPHGDEHLGPHLGHHIATQRPELLSNVDYMCGNPEAARQDPPARYLDSDLNRSFSPPKGQPTTREEHLAQRTMEHIERAQYDYVLDIHTSRSDVDRFVLANHRNKAVDAMIGASVVDRVVFMPDAIAGVALIGRVPNSISIEYSRTVPLGQGVEESIVLIEGLIRGKSLVPPKKRELFQVTRRIPRDEDPGRDVPNFTLCADGYYPVMVSDTYRNDKSKDYLGFAATFKQTVVL